MLARVNNKLHSIYRSFKCRNMAEEPTWEQIPGGFEMKLSSRDFMDRSFYLGDYDVSLVTALRTFAAPGRHCIDIGAHKGYVSLMMSTLVREQGCVFAFEPDADIRGQLLTNLEHNRRTNVRVFEYALGNADGNAEFFISEQSGWSSRFPNKWAESRVKRKVTVPIRSIDAMIAAGELPVDPDQLAFIKVDCEGSEPLVLQGMGTLLQRSAPVLWIEVNQDSLRVANSSIENLQAVIADLGLTIYACHVVTKHGKTAVTYQRIAQLPTNIPAAFDVVATKQRLA